LKAKILLGFELKTAAPVYLGAEYFPETKQHWFPHTGIVAITRHGKTKTVKDLIRRGLEEGVFKRVLFIDSKDERDFKGMGIEVPPCFVDATEPLETKALLEAIEALVPALLVPGGSLLLKLLDCPEADRVATRLRTRFRRSSLIRPGATRRGSSERYLLAREYQGPTAPEC